MFDTTLQKTSIWLNEVMDDLGSHDRHLAYLALRATLHALRDRLPVETAVHLGAQLPMLVRGFYYEGWTVTGKREKQHRKEFLAAIGACFSGFTAPDSERVARAVFKILAQHVTGCATSSCVFPSACVDSWVASDDCATPSTDQETNHERLP